MKAFASDDSGRLLLVANFAPDVGYAWWLVENFWIRTAGIAKASGLEPLIAFPETGAIPDPLHDAEIEVVVCPFPGRGLRNTLRALGLVRSRRVRYVYFTDRPYSSWFYLLLRLLGVCLIINHDHTPGDRPPVAGLRGWVKSRFQRMWWWSCDLQICVSPLIRERAITNGRIPDERAVVVQNGIPPMECTGDRRYAARVLGLPPDKRICVTVARANPYKRIDFAIRVARRYAVDFDRQDLMFVYCGDGPDLQRLSQLATQLEVTEHFIFAGQREDIPQLLCSADFALHTAMGEAFSLAILEYMSAGLAVLVPDVPTVRQAICHGTTGMVYPDGDVDAAAGLLLELSEDPVRRAKLGRDAKLEVDSRFSFSGMNGDFDRVMREALNAGHPSPGAG